MDKEDSDYLQCEWKTWDLGRNGEQEGKGSQLVTVVDEGTIVDRQIREEGVEEGDGEGRRRRTQECTGSGLVLYGLIRRTFTRIQSMDS